jgi:hypothetical protein
MDSNKLDKIGRRRFMKVASTLGISATSLRLGTQEGLVQAMDDPKQEVSYVSRMRVITDQDGNPIGREPEYSTIARDKWVDLETTTKAQEQITNRLHRTFPNSPTLHASITPSDESPTGHEVTVYYAAKEMADGTVVEPQVSRQQVQGTLPNKMTATVGKNQWSAERSGIPVRVTERVVERQTSGYTGYDWAEIPGGCKINGGTACSTFYHTNEDEYHLITAGHVVDSSPSDWGNPTKSDTDGWVIDKVNQANKDYALLRTYSDNAKTMLRNDDGSNPDTDLQIYGGLTDDTIRNDFYGTRKEVKYQGRETGRVTTYVEDFSENTSSSDDQTFQVTQSATSGDSGGIVFNLDSDGNGAWVMGVIMDYGYYGARCNTADSVEYAYPGYFH